MNSNLAKSLSLSSSLYKGRLWILLVFWNFCTAFLTLMCCFTGTILDLWSEEWILEFLVPVIISLLNRPYKQNLFFCCNWFVILKCLRGDFYCYFITLKITIAEITKTISINFHGNFILHNNIIKEIWDISLQQIFIFIRFANFQSINVCYIVVMLWTSMSLL